MYGKLLYVILLICYSIISEGATRNKTSNPRLKSFGQKNFETAVRYYDKDIFHNTLNILHTAKVEMHGFYHIATSLSHWLEVLEEHLMILDGKRFQSNIFSSRSDKNNIRLSTGWSSVLDIIDSVQVRFEGNEESFSNVTSMLSNMHFRSGIEKITLKQSNNPVATKYFNSSDLSDITSMLGEINTINQLHSYCKNKHIAKLKSYVFYMHNQETNCTSFLLQGLNQQDFAKEPMLHDIINSFIIEFPSICLTALVGGYATCGTDFENGTYDSNIWW